jgi:Flp pilus assembly protein TadG
MRGRERGTVTLWVLGLCIALLFLSGLSLDLWRAVATRRQLSAMADAAATAGANGVDEPALRAGTVRLDPSRARALAGDALREGGAAADAVRFDTTDDSVTVTLRTRVHFTLLGIFMGGGDFDVEVHASAAPVERP